MTEFQVDDLAFVLRRSPRRRTLQITVDRGGDLVLAAPEHAEPRQLEAFVREKRYWIYSKLAEKALLQRPIPRKEYVQGEGFLYLGRSYRLKLVEDQDEALKLIAGRFRLRRDLTGEGRAHFIRWYTERGRDWLSTKVSEHARRLEARPSDVKVQDLGYRWGSCGKGGRLYFHWKTILLPRPIAEYVVIHELAHLRHPHHTPEFWQHLERALPDFGRRRQWLAAHGMDVEGI
ncbi:metal-dependent hydrolase [Thioalkalivibrio denitrificans]|uniref:Metal-dependent hydrolase n=1 Tax=Thioalkalivibrio denitrificans TaxID=108003 RepID=A0A1V3NUN6_9GAMM|nr:SprT family zinc-dependent metalloprotease [Thioalkalivibrio denitrificans]OOG28800.1 metal-dependent hydrolase [Thioalkalivibrio denitrificans]